MYGTGDIFGEEEIIQKLSPRETSVVCSSDEGGKVLVLNRQVIKQSSSGFEDRQTKGRTRVIASRVY